ncbi:hypothetical protein F4805DRAFT_453247 [Annulohypoxylon moriforme]|nr:hypothetical protein F4805DRAFT_453247 [Annulohypoxylon moriforme]
MSARLRCYSCASRILPAHLVKPLNTTASPFPVRHFHASLARAAKKGQRLERMDTIKHMLDRAYSWLSRIKQFQQAQRVMLIDISRRNQGPNQGLIERLEESIKEANENTLRSRDIIIEIIEYKVNYTVGKLRKLWPNPLQDVDGDLWPREKYEENWKHRVVKRKGITPLYRPNLHSTTQYNLEMLEHSGRHRSIALLFEAECLKGERRLVKLSKDYSVVSPILMLKAKLENNP